MRIEKLEWHELQPGDRLHEIYGSAGQVASDWCGDYEVVSVKDSGGTIACKCGVPNGGLCSRQFAIIYRNLITGSVNSHAPHHLDHFFRWTVVRQATNVIVGPSAPVVPVQDTADYSVIFGCKKAPDEPSSRWNDVCPRCGKGTYNGFTSFEHDGPCKG